MVYMELGQTKIEYKLSKPSNNQEIYGSANYSKAFNEDEDFPSNPYEHLQQIEEAERRNKAEAAASRQRAKEKMEEETISKGKRPKNIMWRGKWYDEQGIRRKPAFDPDAQQIPVWHKPRDLSDKEVFQSLGLEPSGKKPIATEVIPGSDPRMRKFDLWELPTKLQPFVAKQRGIIQAKQIDTKLNK